MPSDSSIPKLPSEALDAFLEGLLVELRGSTNPKALNEVRAAFRRRIPFHLRSYAAAALILRAAGMSPSSSRDKKTESAMGVKQKPRSADKQAGKDRPRADHVAADRVARKAERDDEGPRPRLAGESATLFFSMGKRQRFYPRILIDLLCETGGLELGDIGEVRAFDNYCFADVALAKAQKTVDALDGHEYRGRPLSVNKAKKRGGEEL